jgi:hypothetical protein
MTGAEGWPPVLSIAEEQWGLLTKQQVEATGVAWSTLSRQVRRGTIERVAHGIYRVRGSADVDHLELRAAWLQLKPGVPAWSRGPADGVVSHRSAADLFGIGHLPADVHEFTLADRKQTRRDDVRLHRSDVQNDWMLLRGLPATRPRRIAADLLADHEDPGAIGQLIADALRAGHESPAAVAHAIAPYALTHGFRRGDGADLLRWLLRLSRDVDIDQWLTGTEPDQEQTA